MYEKVIDPSVSMPRLVLPKDYHPSIEGVEAAKAIQQLNNFIELKLEKEMHLHRISAPLFVEKGNGVNDNLNGIESPVSFSVNAMNGAEAEIVQSLAKWKRMALMRYNILPHEGVYTDMHAIRPDEEPDNLHSLFVDQWDWELCIKKEDRTIPYLKKTVKKLFTILKETEDYIFREYNIKKELPDEIKFVHTEELLQRYPELSPKERETKIVKEYGAVFLIGIGGDLSNGQPQDGRSPDYDDWSSPNEDGYFGLNGDILVWNPVLEQSFELSSMGIRVDKEALLRQLKLKNETERMELLFHKLLLEDKLPLSIGGGIGKSRIGMYFLRKAHIGEISLGLWPKDMIHLCAEHNINLL